MRLQVAICFATVAGFYPGTTAVIPPANDTARAATAISRGSRGPLSGNSEQATDDYDLEDRGGPDARGRDVVFLMDLEPADEVDVTYVLPMADAVVYILPERAALDTEAHGGRFAETGPGLGTASDAGTVTASATGDGGFSWADQAGVGVSEHLSFVAPEKGRFYLVLDAKEKNSGGPWDLSYSVRSAARARDGAGGDLLSGGVPQAQEMTWGDVKGMFR